MRVYLEEKIEELYTKVMEVSRRIDSLQREERWVSDHYQSK